MNHQIEINSHLNAATFPAQLYLPRDLPAAEAAVAVVLHGRGRDDEPLTHESLRLRYPYTTQLQHAADATGTAICIPLLGSFAHLDSPIQPHIRRASFIGQELPAYLITQYGLRPDRRRWSLVGFSMGGTAAVNLLARYADTYAVAANYGGNCNPAFYPEVLKKPAPAENVLGPYDQFPERFREWSNDHALDLLAPRRDIAFALGCGREDPRLAPIRAQRDRLVELGILHTYADYPGGHIYDFAHLLMQLAAVRALQATLPPAPAP